MTNQDIKTVLENEKKILGPSKYSNSKKKKQKSKQVKKEVKDPVITQKNRSLKVKIKNLQKEIKRIENSASVDTKQLKELEIKLEKLIKINKDNFTKAES